MQYITYDPYMTRIGVMEFQKLLLLLLLFVLVYWGNIRMSESKMEITIVDRVISG